MTRLLFAILLGITTLAASMASGAAVDFYVSPNGNDSWSGKIASPNEDGTDGPYATINRAKEAVRALRASSPNGNIPIKVVIRGGNYFLSEPLIFTPEDSGTAESPVIYSAYSGENPVISGGRLLTGWKKVSNGVWEVRIPEAVKESKYLCQLFVNGARRYRTRLPEKGYYYIADAVDPTPKVKGTGFDRFKFSDNDIDGSWHNLNDVEILPFHIWTNSRIPVGQVDDKEKIVTLAGKTAADTFWSSMPKGNRFLVDNVKEALDKPGEWYFDRKSGVLSYISMRNEDMNSAEVIVPWIEYPVQIKGDIENRRWVSNITFKGLSFMHSNWVLPEGGYSCGQAEFVLRGFITADGARDCSIENSTIAHTGAHGIEWGSACKRNRVENCELVDLGAGGIKVGTGGYYTDDDLVTGNTTIRNNVITHGGRIHSAGEGVLITGSPYNIIANNDIHDFYYTGVNVGWSWGYGPSNAHHNTVENNHIYNIGQGVLSDMGGIYTLGIADGSVLRHNLIHDIMSFGYGGWGIYLDEGTTHMLVENNVVYRTKAGGFHQHYGKENTIQNNIFAFAQDGQIIRTRSEEHLSFTFMRNIIYWNMGPLLGSNWASDNYKLDYNTYWNSAGTPFTFAGASLKEWQARGQDVHSIIKDPGFVNPDKGDFRLKSDSPAFETGFKQIDMKGFGSSKVKRRVPDKLLKDNPYPYTQMSSDVSEDFDSIKPGAPVPGMQMQMESDAASVAVTDEKSASGRHSLKFTDAPGQKYSFSPHAVYSPEYNWGIAKLSFNLMMEPDAMFWNEWRTIGTPYQIGPSIRIENGVLKANGKQLMDIPYDKWVKFEIVCSLGDKADGKYSLTVTPSGERKSEFKNISHDPSFSTLRWLGFVSDGEKKSAFYIDDIKLTRD